MSRTYRWIGALFIPTMMSACTEVAQPSTQPSADAPETQDRDRCSNISGVQETVPPDKKRDRWTARCLSPDRLVQIRADRRRQNRIIDRALQAAMQKQERAERELLTTLEAVPASARSLVVVSVLCDNPSAVFGTTLSEGPEKLYSLDFLGEQYSKYVGDASIDLPVSLMSHPEGGSIGAYQKFCPSRFAG